MGIDLSGQGVKQRPQVFIGVINIYLMGFWDMYKADQTSQCKHVKHIHIYTKLQTCISVYIYMYRITVISAMGI